MRQNPTEVLFNRDYKLRGPGKSKFFPLNIAESLTVKGFIVDITCKGKVSIRTYAFPGRVRKGYAGKEFRGKGVCFLMGIARAERTYAR